MSNCNKAVSQSEKSVLSINELRRRMRTTNTFFHFSRNNPRNTARYYYVFIYKLSNEWEYLDEKITAAWISSKNSFDKLYGVIRALYLSGISFEDLKADAEKRKEKQDSEKIKVKICSLSG